MPHITTCYDTFKSFVLIVCGEQQFGHNSTPHTNRFIHEQQESRLKKI